MNVEQSKYEQLWARHPSYRAVAPGEEHAALFLSVAKVPPSSTIIDFGAGTGRGAATLHAMTGARVLMLDFAQNCLDDEVRDCLDEQLQFRQHDLLQPVGEVADFGICTDVMEHIPPADVDRVLTNVMSGARRVYFAISTVEDQCGALIGEPLHLTVKPHVWWRERLTSLGFRVDYEREFGDECSVFYGSAYASQIDFSANSKLNTEESRIIANIKHNLSLNLQEVAPHAAQPEATVLLLAGGPSLCDDEAEIVERGRAGVPIVAVNGTYGWLLDRGIRPAAYVSLDAREFNARFVTRIVDSCKYFVCSQSDPAFVESLPAAQTWLWHSGGSELVKRALDEWAEETGRGREWFPVHGGSTVTSRAVTLLAMLGFRNVEVFGWDSCLRNGEHHAYSQPENDSRSVVRIRVAGREFACHPWMVVQAGEFSQCVRHIWGQLPDFRLAVRGDGLIAHILSTAADRAASVCAE